MSDKSPSEQNEGEEAVIGVKADVKTLQQLSSSGQAAKEKRVRNQVDRAMASLEAAARNELQSDSDRNQEQSHETPQ